MLKIKELIETKKINIDILLQYIEEEPSRGTYYNWVKEIDEDKGKKILNGLLKYSSDILVSTIKIANELKINMNLEDAKVQITGVKNKAGGSISNINGVNVKLEDVGINSNNAKGLGTNDDEILITVREILIEVKELKKQLDDKQKIIEGQQKTIEGLFALLNK